MTHSERGLPLLAARSFFSLMEGALSPGRICKFASENGYKTLAITDINRLHALPQFVEDAASYGLKPIAGVFIKKDGAAGLHAWCLNRKGYSRLCKILTDMAFDPAFDPVISLASEGWDGLAIALSDDRMIAELLAGPWYRDSRGLPYGRPFVALETARPTLSSARLARQLDLPALAVPGGLYLENDDIARLRLLFAIDKRVTLSALPDSRLWDEPGQRARLPSCESALSCFSAWPEAVRNAIKLADDAQEAGSFFSDPPAFPSWRGQPESESFRALKSLCQAGIASRYGGAGQEARIRLERELRIIEKRGFASYFLVVRDIIPRDAVICGRGSAASSLVAYLLGLSHVDPIRYNLFFERFLNEGRLDPPDIDIDFPWDERPKILERVFRDYAGSVAMVADHCRFSGRSRLREAALAMGKNSEEAMALTDAWFSGRREVVPPDIAGAGSLLKNIPRYIGTHPGGVVIVPGAITDYAPCQMSPAGLPLLAWEKDGTERAGLVKIDLLGNRSLAVLRDCLMELGKKPEYRNKLGWQSFNPIDEPRAKALIESAGTIGIFYIESPATRQLLVKMKKADYIHLVAASSIIRPAANRYINEYVQRMRGKKWKPLPAAAEECLKESYGIMVYQEDVSRIAMAVAGFSSADADILRKVLTKKRDSPGFGAIREKFYSACKTKDIEDEAIDELWSMMLSFDGYSFCKAHSVSYAQLSYKLAWMKAWHPGQFFSAVINNGGGFYSTQTYIEEAKRSSWKILPPHVNHSEIGYRVVSEDIDEDGMPKGGVIRAGLAQVSHIPQDFMRAVYEERNTGGPYKSPADFLDRLKPSYELFRPLVLSGAMDGDDPDSDAWNRPRLLWAWHGWKGRPEKTAELFPETQAGLMLPDYAPAYKLRLEMDFLGVILSAGPAELYDARAELLARKLSWPLPLPSAKMAAFTGRRVSMYGVAIAGKEVITGSGKKMSFRSLADKDGVFEVLIFPQAYHRFLPILEGNTALLVLGTVNDDFGAISLEMEDVRGLNRRSGRLF